MAVTPPVRLGELAGLPLAEADRLAVEAIEAARQDMAAWAAARAARIHAEITARGLTRAQVAAVLGVTPKQVSDLLLRHGYAAGTPGRPVMRAPE